MNPDTRSLGLRCTAQHIVRPFGAADKSHALMFFIRCDIRAFLHNDKAYVTTKI